MESVLRGMMKNRERYPTNTEFTDDRVTMVLQHHPRRKAKQMTGKLRWVGNRYNHTQRILEFEKVPGSWFTIGWKKYANSVTLLAPVPSAPSASPTATRGDVALALRDLCGESRKMAQRDADAVHNKGVLLGTCQLCEEHGVQVQMDHGEIPFEQIVSDFVKQHGISVMTIPVRRRAHGLHWEVDDLGLSTAFQKYHDSLVKYQSLCIPCHTVKTKDEAGERAQKRRKRTRDACA